MDESRFWMLVDAARSRAGAHPQARPPALRAALAELSALEIQSFQRTYDRMRERANRQDLRAAADLMLGGSGELAFSGFRDWLISEGRESYERALADPDGLAELAPQDDVELEAFGDAALDAYAERTDKALERDRPDDDAPPDGSMWDGAERAARLPRLAARYGR